MCMNYMDNIRNCTKFLTYLYWRKFLNVIFNCAICSTENFLNVLCSIYIHICRSHTDFHKINHTTIHGKRKHHVFKYTVRFANCSFKIIFHLNSKVLLWYYEWVFSVICAMHMIFWSCILLKLLKIQVS